MIGRCVIKSAKKENGALIFSFTKESIVTLLLRVAPQKIRATNQNIITIKYTMEILTN